MIEASLVSWKQLLRLYVACYRRSTSSNQCQNDYILYYTYYFLDIANGQFTRAIFAAIKTFGPWKRVDLVRIFAQASAIRDDSPLIHTFVSIKS